MIEAIQKIEALTGRRLNYLLTDQARKGDHIWWVSDVSKFRCHYPRWDFTYSLDDLLEEIVEASLSRYGGAMA